MQNRLLRFQEYVQLQLQQTTPPDSRDSSLDAEIFDTYASPKVIWTTPESPLAKTSTPKNDFFNRMSFKIKRENSKTSKNTLGESMSRAQSRKNLTIIGDPKKGYQRSNTKSLKEVKSKTPKKARAPAGLKTNEYQQLMNKLESILSKQDGPRKLKEVVRRKSCCCNWCGGESHKEKKFDHIFAKKQAKQQEKEEGGDKLPSRKKKNRQKLQTIVVSNNSLDLDMNEKIKTIVLKTEKQSSKRSLLNPNKTLTFNTDNNDSQLSKTPRQTKQIPENIPEVLSPKNEEKTPTNLPPMVLKIQTNLTTPSVNSSTVKSSTHKTNDANWRKFRNKINELSTPKVQPKDPAPHSTRIMSKDRLLTTVESTVFTPKSSRLACPDKFKMAESPYIEYSNAIKEKKVIPTLALFKTTSANKIQNSLVTSPLSSRRRLSRGNLGFDMVVSQPGKSSKLSPKNHCITEADMPVEKTKFGATAKNVFKNYEPAHLPKVHKKGAMRTEVSQERSEQLTTLESQETIKNLTPRKPVLSPIIQMKGSITSRRDTADKVLITSELHPKKQIASLALQKPVRK